MSQPLGDILSAPRESAPAAVPVEPSQATPEPRTEPKPAAVPGSTPAPSAIAASSQPKPQTPASGDDDDAEPQAVEHDGQKLVPKAALDASRGKVKRYTEQVLAFEKQIAESNKRAEEREKALEQRFNQFYGMVQPLLQQRQSQQPQPQPEQRPDFFADPDAAVDARIAAAMAQHHQQYVAPIAQNLQSYAETTSQRFAVARHGQEAVNAAFDALDARIKTDPRAQAEYERMMRTRDPWGELVNWHKRETATAEIGLDPAAYREKLKAEILAEIGSQGQPQAQASAAPQGQAQAASPVMPTNLAGVRNAGQRSGPAWGGPEPIQDIFNRAQKPRSVA